MSNFENIKSILLKVWTLLTVIFTALTSIIQGTPATSDKILLINESQYVLDSAIVAGQGLSADDEYIYTSGAVSALYLGGLGKIDRSTGEFIQKNIGAIPSEFTSKGYDHIGGISVYDGKIYAAVEDKAEETPLVLIYSCEDLSYTGEYYDMTNDVLDDGIPWLTVDGENGYLYTSTFHNAEEICVYKLADMSFSHYIILNEPVDRVQDGVYLDGKLYLNLDPDTDDYTKTVAVIDIASGKVEQKITRPVAGIKTETEGIYAYKNADGETSLLITDYDKTVSIFMREYVLK